MMFYMAPFNEFFNSITIVTDISTNLVVPGDDKLSLWSGQDFPAPLFSVGAWRTARSVLASGKGR